MINVVVICVVAYLQAKKKGTSVTVAGLILAIYQLVCMLVTLPIGNYVSSFTEK